MNTDKSVLHPDDNGYIYEQLRKLMNKLFVCSAYNNYLKVDKSRLKLTSSSRL